LGDISIWGLVKKDISIWGLFLGDISIWGLTICGMALKIDDISTWGLSDWLNKNALNSDSYIIVKSRSLKWSIRCLGMTFLLGA
jgi:hypothetical protein